jgi:hypothetical protein
VGFGAIFNESGYNESGYNEFNELLMRPNKDWLQRGYNEKVI